MTTATVDQLLLPGQAAAVPGPVDLTAMYVMHHAFRRDLTAFKKAVVGTPVEDRVTWRALALRWGKFCEILHKHHTGEDAGLWPLLLARADAAGRETLEAMEAEHAEIDPLLESCTAGFERLAGQADPDARDALEVRVVALNELLSRHLAHEERDAMALVQRHLLHADWERLEKEHFKPAYGPRDLPFIASWALYGLPAEHFGRVRDSMAGRPRESPPSRRESTSACLHPDRTWWEAVVMALAVCLLFDRRSERILRNLWDRLEEVGVPTLRSHTHGRHVPHLSLAVLREWDHDKVKKAVEALPGGGSVGLYFDALGTFRRGRAWLVPAVGADVLQRQERTVAAVTATGADLHRHYQPGLWVPHCTLAPRVPLVALPILAAAVYDVLPLEATADRAALIDSGTGQLWPLTNLP